MPVGEKTKELWKDPEYRKRMSEVHKGNPGYWKGKKLKPGTVEKQLSTKKKNNSFTRYWLGKKHTAVLGDKNNAWKGNKVGYSALHKWVKRNYDWSDCCGKCGGIKLVQLASKNYKYDRDKKNWWILCRKCHVKYDIGNKKWGYATKRFNLVKSSRGR